jgi:hypothetical protein
MKKRIGRPPVKDKRGIVSFTALSSVIKLARKKQGLKALNRFLEEKLNQYVS